jgi:hypothetical protein
MRFPIGRRRVEWTRRRDISWKKKRSREEMGGGLRGLGSALR